MKILFINGVVDYGSTGRIVRELSDGLINEGHETLIIYGRKSAQKINDTFPIVDKYGTLFHVLMTRALGRHGLHSKRATKRLIAKISEFKPDVIHLHNIHGYYLNYPMLFKFIKELKDIKIVWTHHDCWSFSGNSAYFDFHGCKEWDEGCVVCNSTKDYPEAIIYSNQKRNFKLKKKHFTNITDIVHVTPSDWLTSMMKKTFHNYAPIITINNGIDTNLFKPTLDFEKLSRYGIDTNKKILLGVASDWENRKGLNVFKELSYHLNDDEQIVLVGVDDVRKKGLPSNIIAISRTNSVEDLALLYSHATFFINPTYEDNFPTTNLESLACGTPVITFKTGGSGEGITSTCGLVIENKTAKGLRDAIDTFKIDESTSEACRNLAVQKFDKSLSNKNYLELILKGV